MDFLPKKGCPMCGIVATASQNAPQSPLTPTFAQAQQLQPEILWKDENFTAYRERANPVSSKCHIIIVFNLHVPSLYTLSSSDVPLLVSLRLLAQRLLSNYSTPIPPLSAGLQVPNSATSSSTPPPYPPFPPSSPSPFRSSSLLPSASASTPAVSSPRFRIGFITPPWKDNKIPVKDHLHVHAYIEPLDLAGWWRGMAYGPLAWYEMDDLIAEIRESTSNNRVKSGYENRTHAPIDMIPQAGARSGTADGKETTDTTLAAPDIETGPRTPSSSRSGSQSSNASSSGSSSGSRAPPRP